MIGSDQRRNCLKSIFAAFPNTSLSDNNFNNVDFTADARHDHSPRRQSTTVPEPSTALPLAGAMLLATWLIRRRTA